MQNVIKFVVVLFITIGSLSAQNKVYNSKSNFTLSTSLVGMSMDYREYDDANLILDSEKSGYSDLNGFELGLDYVFRKTPSSHMRINANLMMLQGSTQYVGSILGSGNPYGSFLSVTENKLVDYEVSFKHNLMITNALELGYGIGIGHRVWDRGLSATQLEIYTWNSIRTELFANYNVTSRLKLGVAYEYQFGMNTEMSLSSPSLNFTLGGADISQISIPVRFAYTNRIDFFAAMTFEKQEIKKSNTVGGFLEPKSTAKNKFIRVGVDFKF
ncbi:hypothetical protein JHD48_09055 [Sulfurimonas sp. SAG-AH-194-I05]|nr:hypothetical protein [Sulfurimonas sp. SAG-AH-194-I05]MDF1875882.1 hypothetical protein [Sulfurimonas sp. SAG-AH-194-I05]